MQQTIEYLSQFNKQKGIYIIRPKNVEILKSICSTLGYPFRSEIAYVGKAKNLKTRGKQEMGWQNFDGATFVRKIGTYLGFDIKDKYNKALKEETKNYINQNFTIECIPLKEEDNLLLAETKYISIYQPCMNVKKI